MKLPFQAESTVLHIVALFTRAWIEIKYSKKDIIEALVALFTRAWIEMFGCVYMIPQRSVALFTRAWIEIVVSKLIDFIPLGRLLHEGVD